MTGSPETGDPANGAPADRDPVSGAARTDEMIRARRGDSATKRARVLATLERMLADGTPITFASVARVAEVSTWLVHAPGVRDAVAETRARQHTRAAAIPKPDPVGSSLRVDLALARAEITRLRAGRDQHQQQLRLALGAQLDNLAKAELIGRIDELTHANTQLAAAATQAQSDNEHLRARLTELEDDLAAARTSLRAMIRAENRPTATTPPA